MSTLQDQEECSSEQGSTLAQLSVQSDLSSSTRLDSSTISSLNRLSPELVEQIFLQTLDYSIQINNRQLKRLCLVSKGFYEIAIRLLVRSIHITHIWRSEKCRYFLTKKPQLQKLVKSLTFGSISSPTPAQHRGGIHSDSELLALAPLCEIYDAIEDDRDANNYRRGSELVKPTFPNTHRFLRLRYPKVPGFVGDSASVDDYFDGDNGELIVPDSARTCIESATKSISHLSIEGSRILDFASPPPSPIPLNPLSQLASVDVEVLDIHYDWLNWLLQPSIRSGTLKKLRINALILERLDSLAQIFRSASDTLVDLELTFDGVDLAALKTLEEHPVLASKRLVRLCIQLRSSRLTRKIPKFIFSLPSTLREIILVTGAQFPRAFDVVRHLATSTSHSIQSITILAERGTSRRSFPFLPPRVFVPVEPGSTSNRQSSTVAQLRIEGTRIQRDNFEEILKLLGPNLRYLSLDDTACLPNWKTLRENGKELRWLELGSIAEASDEQVNLLYGHHFRLWESEAEGPNSGAEDDAEMEEILRQSGEPPLYEEEEFDSQSRHFETLSLPHLEYLSVDLFSRIDTKSVYRSIVKNRFPNLKVVDFDCLRQIWRLHDLDYPKKITEGLELLVAACRERGITFAMEGKPIDGVADLFWHLTVTLPERDSEDEED